MSDRLKAVLRWLSTLLISTAAFGWCAVLLSQTAIETAAAAARPAQPPSLRVQTHKGIDPLPPGSITAVAPLPRKPVPAVAPTGPAVANPAPEVWRVTTGVNVRAQASKDAARVATLEAGELVTISTRQRNWVLVASEAGTRGWVYGTFLVRNGDVARSGEIDAD